MVGQILLFLSWFVLIGAMCWLCIAAVGWYDKKER